MDQTVKCNKCGTEITIQLETKEQGDLEYNFFRCPNCNTVYVASCTDPALRADIARYEELVERAQDLTIQAQALLKENVRRSRELIDQNPLAL